MTSSASQLRTAIPGRDGCLLSALVAGPATASRTWVLFVHGFAAEATEAGLFTGCMDRLKAAGISSASYDWRGLGLSQGDFVAAPLAQHVEDFRAVLAWVAHRADAVHVVGFSLGCALATLGCEATDRRVASCIFLSPALRPRVSMWPRYDTATCRQQLQQTGILVKAENGVRIGQRLLIDLRRLDLHKSALRSPWPYLICHGTADQRIPISETLDLLRQHPNARTTFQRIPGASHSFKPEERHRDRLYRQITRWLEGGFRLPPRARRAPTSSGARRPEAEPALA